MPNIFLARERFFYNRLTRSSHVQFRIKDDESGYVDTGSYRLRIASSENMVQAYDFPAVFDASTGYWNIIYRGGPRSISLWTLRKNSIRFEPEMHEWNGEYVEADDLNGRIVTYDGSKYIHRSGRYEIDRTENGWRLVDNNPDPGEYRGLFAGLDNDSHEEWSMPPAAMYHIEYDTHGDESAKDRNYSVRSIFASGEVPVSISGEILDGNDNRIQGVMIWFTEDEPYSFNADDYAGSAPGIHDSVEYENPKTLALRSVPSEQMYAVQIFSGDESSSSSSAELSEGARRVVFKPADSLSPVDPGTSFGMSSVSAVHGSFLVHPCRNYIVEACHLERESNGQTVAAWQYRLYEAVKYGRTAMTVPYLGSVGTASANAFDGLSQSSEINYNSVSGAWSIGANGTVVDYMVFDGDVPSVISDSLKCTTISGGGNMLYRAFYNTVSSDNVLNCLGICRFRNDGFMKGRLVAVAETASFEAEVSFEGCLESFRFTSNLPYMEGAGNLCTLEYLVQDEDYVFPIGNAPAIIFSLGANESSSSSGGESQLDELLNEAKVPGLEIMRMLKPGSVSDYFDSSLEDRSISDHVAGRYFVSAFSIRQGDVSMPYVDKEKEIVFFHDDIDLSLGDSGLLAERGARVYVNKSSRPVDYPFVMEYNGIKLDDYRIPLSKIEVSTVRDQLGTYAGNDSTQFTDYPFVWSSVYFDNDTSSDAIPSRNIKYENGNYVIRLPYGNPPLVERERVIIPELNRNGVPLGGTYSLMTYQEVNDDSNISRLEGNAPFTEATYAGANRIYYNSVNSLYIETARINDYDTGIFWMITDSPVYPGNIRRQYYLRSRDSVPVDQSNASTDPENYLSRYLWGNYSDSSYELAVTRLPSGSEHGMNKTLYMRFSDKYGNSTGVSTGLVQIYQMKPAEVSVNLTGSSGDPHYTGFYRKYDRFFPSEFIKISFSAVSSLRMKYRLLGDIVDNRLGWQDLESGRLRQVVAKVRPGGSEKSMLNLMASEIRVYVVVVDEAGNTNVQGWEPEEIWDDAETVRRPSEYAFIYYMSKLFRTKHQHLLEESSSYKHSLYSLIGDRLYGIDRRQVSTTDFTRSWNEVWYPSNHGVPLNDDGSIDVENARRISQVVSGNTSGTDESGVNGPTDAELELYDRLSINASGELEVDNDGRYINSVQYWSRSKTYPGMENNRMSKNAYQKYWIIDNTGNVDFKLEFEIFDFNGKITSIPANLAAPEDGDMLCVYDASDPDATETILDQYGNKRYYLKDSSKLSLLFILKGSGFDQDNPPAMVNSKVVGDLQVVMPGCVTPSITSCSRICLVPFTDYGDTSDSVASGFKLKAGPRHAAQYVNYDSNESTGEFWVHQSPVAGSYNWTLPDAVAVNYKYYGSFATLDYEKGTVKFDEPLDGPVIGTFPCYAYLESDGVNNLPYEYFSCYNPYYSGLSDAMREHVMKSFATTEDDFVDYQEASFYVTNVGSTPIRNGYYDFKNNSSINGKMINGYSLVKDTGILQFTGSVPFGRLFGDYYYHTFYRLTSDGYGDLYYYGTGILVPAKATTEHTDWTHVDVKIVNEGTASLNSGILKFLARGYITKGSVVDVVLDMNRPWDVQEGTTAETVKRTGGVYSTSFSTLQAATRENAYYSIRSQEIAFGVLEPKKSMYARIFWCIANNAHGTAWIEAAKGSKTYSAELSGIYYILSV